jgi:hypothetical protein
MRIGTRLAVAWSIAALGFVGVEGVAAKPKAGPFTPHIDPAAFDSVVSNPWFPLVPGTRYTYRETFQGRTSDNEVSVLAEKKIILGVTCTVVHDVLREGGAITEDTYDWYAQDKQGTVWYFGESTREFLHRGRVSTEGSWETGVDGAQPGILIAARPEIGEPYRQEYLRGRAEDMGQVVALADSVTVPFGTFRGCVKTKDWSMLEAGTEHKWYAPGVGLVRSESASKEISVLVSVAKP